MDIIMHRFFVSETDFENDNVTISGDVEHQITRVLRLKTGERITLLDNSGWEYLTEIEAIKRSEVRGKVIKREMGAAEPMLKLTLYQALLKSDKFEFVLQKGVELGVSYFAPFVSNRCIVRRPSDNRLERWRNIIKEASEQSRRAILPGLNGVVSFKEACRTAEKPALILWEEEKSTGLASALKSHEFKKMKSISVFVGPEGSFTPTEIKLAEQNGIIPVGLGKRILRAETAGLVAISAIMYEKGELG
jgi:16S rRNA (uracil1498-N3)-methyltransferase